MNNNGLSSAPCGTPCANVLDLLVVFSTRTFAICHRSPSFISPISTPCLTPYWSPGVLTLFFQRVSFENHCALIGTVWWLVFNRMDCPKSCLVSIQCLFFSSICISLAATILSMTFPRHDGRLTGRKDSNFSASLSFLSMVMMVALLHIVGAYPWFQLELMIFRSISLPATGRLVMSRCAISSGPLALLILSLLMTCSSSEIV